MASTDSIFLKICFGSFFTREIILDVNQPTTIIYFLCSNVFSLTLKTINNKKDPHLSDKSANL